MRINYFHSPRDSEQINLNIIAPAETEEPLVVLKDWQSDATVEFPSDTTNDRQYLLFVPVVNPYSTSSLGLQEDPTGEV